MDRNPKLFREMSEPHESVAAFGEHTQAFFYEVSQLREKYRITNVVMVVQAQYEENGEEHSALATRLIGDTGQAQALFAYGYGVARAENEAFIKLLKGGR
jgi:hypothetical protein